VICVVERANCRAAFFALEGPEKGSIRLSLLGVPLHLDIVRDFQRPPAIEISVVGLALLAEKGEAAWAVQDRVRKLPFFLRS